MTADPIVFVVDDDPAVRRGVERLVRSVGLRAESFATPQEFLQRGAPDRPACLVLDVRMPGLGGLDLQAALAGSGVEIPIVFITGHGTVPTSVRAMKAGAVDFLEKPFDDQALLDAIRKAIERDERARRDRAERREMERRVQALTPREREVLGHVVAGKLNKQTAYDLGITEKTVKAHRARVMEKMAAGSVADLVRLAEKAGIRPPST